MYMNVFAKFDEIPSMILEVIKETKHYGHTDGRMDGRTFGQRENSIPVHICLEDRNVFARFNEIPLMTL